MRYYLNGNYAESTEEITLLEALSACDEFKEDSIIILNEKYVKQQENYDFVQINEGDKIEVISFLAGG